LFLNCTLTPINFLTKIMRFIQVIKCISNAYKVGITNAKNILIYMYTKEPSRWWNLKHQWSTCVILWHRYNYEMIQEPNKTKWSHSNINRIKPLIISQWQSKIKKNRIEWLIIIVIDIVRQTCKYIFNALGLLLETESW